MTDLEQSLHTRIDRLVSLLALPERARDVLVGCVSSAIDAETARSLREEDLFQRAAVLPWLRLAGTAADDADLAALEAGALALHAWGIVQIVGMDADDPVVAGDAPLRITGPGRACVGLAPAPLRPISANPLQPWRVLHGASRERLLLEARLGPDELILASDSTLKTGFLCGQVAATLLACGRVVVDATLASAFTLATGVAAMLSRTRIAAAERLLLVTDPTPLRSVVLEIGAEMAWIEPDPVARRGGWVLDERVGERLAARYPGSRASDWMGVPDVETAVPRRSSTRWEEVAVPDEIRAQLDRVLQHARFRLRPGGRGYRLLLSGSPGTGKSMIARALAHALDRPLVSLDLSSVLSRWMGETERNLSRIFDVAETSDAVLVLDEAEALLRQRPGEGGGEGIAVAVAYLLTRLDAYRGVLVGTTNRMRELDEAFFRRFDDFVIMPIPDEATRRRIWTRCLDAAGVPYDVDLDLLAHRFAIAGGQIEGAAQRAAAWADGDQMGVTTPVLLASLYRELEKSDKAPTEVLVAPYKSAVERILRGTRGG